MRPRLITWKFSSKLQSKLKPKYVKRSYTEYKYKFWALKKALWQKTSMNCEKSCACKDVCYIYSRSSCYASSQFKNTFTRYIVTSHCAPVVIHISKTKNASHENTLRNTMASSAPHLWGFMPLTAEQSLYEAIRQIWLRCSASDYFLC